MIKIKLTNYIAYSITWFKEYWCRGWKKVQMYE